MSKKYKIIALFLLAILVIGLIGCGGKSKKTNAKKNPAKPVVSQENTANQAVQTTPVNITENTVEKTDIALNRMYLSPEEFGRENPFFPVRQFEKKSKIPEDKSALIAANEARLVPKNIPKAPVKTEVMPNVALTLVIDNKTAIFQDSSGSKVASVGDSIAGMKIVEIRNNEAILDGGSEKYAVSLGGRIAKISSKTAK